MSPETQGRLAEWLHELPAFGRRSEIVALEPVSGGQSSEMLSLVCRNGPDAPGERFVIRLEQRGKQLFLTPDIAREFAVIDGVAKHSAVPVPEMMALEPTGQVLGTPFLVMRHVEGESPLGRPSMHTSGLLTRLTPAERRALALNGLDATAGIHAIDWRVSHPFLAPADGESGFERHLRQLAEWYRWATAGRPFPITDAALDYLLRHRSSLHDEPDVLLWGDCRPGNIMFAADQSVAAVLDWEGALIGPRGLDMAYWVMMDRFHAEMIGIERAEGWLRESEVLSHYREAAQAEVHDLDYFIVLGAFFMGTTLIRAADIGVERGKLQAGTRMGHDNTLTQIIAERLGLALPPLSPDFTAHRGLPAGFVGRVG